MGERLSVDVVALAEELAAETAKSANEIDLRVRIEPLIDKARVGLGVTTDPEREKTLDAGGEGSAPIVMGNRLHDNDNAGIMVEGAAGEITGNDVSGNWHGIAVSGYGAAPLIEGNFIHDCYGSGILVGSGMIPSRVAGVEIVGNTISRTTGEPIDMIEASPYISPTTSSTEAPGTLGTDETPVPNGRIRRDRECE